MSERTLSEPWRLRSLRAADAAALLGLVQECLVHEAFSAQLLAEKIWADPRFDEDLALVLVDQDDIPLGFILGLVRERDHERIAVIKLMAVARQQQGRGLGRLLLEELERRFAAQGLARIQLASSPPNYLWPGLDPRYERALSFFRAAGYVESGETCNLSVDLTALPAAVTGRSVLAQDVEIRRAEPSDLAAVRATLSEHWPSWIPEVAVGFRQVPISVHIALHAGVVLGFAAYDCNNIGTGFFGPMGTVPESRGLGLGRMLLLRSLEDMAAQGHRQGTISWVGPVAFYQEAVGAKFQRRFLHMEKTLTEHY